MSKKAIWKIRYSRIDCSSVLEAVFDSKDALYRFIDTHRERIERGEFALCSVMCVSTTLCDVRAFYPGIKKF